MEKINIIIITIILTVVTACDTDSPDVGFTPFSKEVIQTTRLEVTPQLNHPDKTLVLPKKLTEISALSLAPDTQNLLAVNDEKGTLYFLDQATGDITNTVKFGKSGDYEGLEAIGNDVYIIKSNGKVFLVKEAGATERQVSSVSEKLSPSYDVEGMGYDKQQARLLIACKSPVPHQKDNRAIYAFDLQTQEYSPQPVFLISSQEITRYLKQNQAILKTFSSIGTAKEIGESFAPSGIAIHPKTNDIYVISSVGKALLVLDKNGTIKTILPLYRKIHQQPEGICFNATGTQLFISNEGRNKKAKISIFSLERH